MIPIKNPNISTNRYKELLRTEKYYKEYRDKYFNSNNEISTLKDRICFLEDIIEEVREYIMTNGIHSDYGDKGIDDENKLLEILDKENK